MTDPKPKKEREWHLQPLPIDPAGQKFIEAMKYLASLTIRPSLGISDALLHIDEVVALKRKTRPGVVPTTLLEDGPSEQSASVLDVPPSPD